MQAQSKKYYSIKEVSEMLCLSAKRLRSLDYLLKTKLTRIRGRRYYQNHDIELLKNFMSSHSLNSLVKPTNKKYDNTEITNEEYAVSIAHVDRLISSMQQLKAELKAIL